VLYSADNQTYITKIPHRREYDIWRLRLSDAQFQAIYDDLHSRVDGSEIETSSWIPGADWSGTVFEPIYNTACQYDEAAAARFFGLMLWQVIMEHEQVWAFGRYEKDGVPIEGLTYFRLSNPPTR
jgi:hypothetical protein